LYAYNDAVICLKHNYCLDNNKVVRIWIKYNDMTSNKI
jgi:hypothetical protein